MTIEYKWLDGDFAKDIDPWLESKGLPSLNPYTTRALGAYDGTRLVGFLVVQLFPMVGPGWTEREYRGQGIFQEMSKQVQDFLKETEARAYIAIADSPHTEKICEAAGMHKLDVPVYGTW